MEKTIHISINATSFQLTEGAYQKLKTYLESLKAHFAHETDSPEIIRDIESRIAEKMLERNINLIHESEITQIIEDIGEASEFDLGSDQKETGTSKGSDSSKQGERKLYRNTDDIVVMGVASGIAAYFDVDPIYIRIAFVASIFFGGLGVAIYLLLSFLMPPAQSASQKLEMRGDAVTLDAITRTIKDRAEEVNKEIKQRGRFSKILLLPITILGAIARLIHKKIIPGLGKLLGFFIIVITFLATIALTGLLNTIAANWDSIDAPIREIVARELLWIDIGAIYIALLIPLLLILSLGQKLITRSKQTFSNAVGFGLVGVWCFAIIIGAATTTRIVADYRAELKTNPDYQIVTEEISLEAFNSLTVSDARILIRKGDTQSVVLEGQRINFNRVKAEVIDGTLSISTLEEKDECLFCNQKLPQIIITTPELSLITTKDASVNFETFTASNLEISTEDSSVRGDVQLQNLIIKSRNSHFSIDGKTNTLDVTLRNSSFNAEDLESDTTTIHSIESYSHLHASSTVSSTLDDGSHIEQNKNLSPQYEKI